MEIRLIDNLQEKEQKKKLVYPNFIYNRQDIFCPLYDLFEIKEANKIFYIEVGYSSDTEANMGIWLTPSSKDVFIKITDYVFKNHPDVQNIHFTYSFCEMGYSYNKNHYRIVLPATAEELHARLSPKGRHNIKREKRLIEEQVGPCCVEEYRFPDIPPEIIDLYFKMKQNTHGTQYAMKGEEYIKHYHVTNCYVLKAADKVLAILLSCEYSGMVVYLENLTYDTNYHKFSPGQVLYDWFLCKLIEKGFKEIFLAGGTTSYKKRYGGIEDTTYCGIIFRSWLKQIFYTFKQYIKHFVVKMRYMYINRKKGL